jgi:hypothetical protein
MQVISRIDHLITELANLKPTLSEDSSSNQKRFNDLLTASIDTGKTAHDKEIEATLSINEKSENEIPSWVDPDYGYDPQNPRKPNMRELMEAMSGKSVEDLYADPYMNWQKISRQASEMLYGVVGANEDSRDWPSIMNSSDILSGARKQTGAMYNPEVSIQSYYNDDGIMTEQIAVIKDNKGNTLRSLSNDTTSAEEALLNFGATKESIPTNLEERINPEKFDSDLLAFLKNFDNHPTSIQQVVVQSASEVIANKISQEIPLDELAKL